jgi:CheY-like chemotaxis protein
MTTKPFSPKKVLLVEDDLPFREALSTRLRQKGLNIFEAENGEDGFKLFLQETPDFIVTDFSMPRMTGGELIKEVRNNNTKVPIFLVTGSLIDAHILKVLVYERVLISQKPLKEETLDSVLREFFSSTHYEQKRKYVRCKLSLDAQTEEMGTVFVENLSFGGAAIVSTRMPDIGQDLTLILPLSNDGCRISSRVIWISAIEEEVKSYRLGVEFKNVSDEITGLLERKLVPKLDRKKRVFFGA